MPGRPRHSPEGPALFCSKPERFEKSQKSASFFWGWVLEFCCCSKKRRKPKHLHEQMRNSGKNTEKNSERNPEMNFLMQSLHLG